MTAFDRTHDAPLTTRTGEDGRSHVIPASAIRWQASFYRSYLTDALSRLASDPNPDVQRIGEEMRRCLSCAAPERCAECPFNRNSNAVRGFATRP